MFALFAVGPEVTRFKVGDDVIGVLPVSRFFNVTTGSCEVEEFYLGMVCAINSRFCRPVANPDFFRGLQTQIKGNRKSYTV